MPSRAEMRVGLEHILRGVVITTLAVMLWQSLQQPTDSGGETLGARGVSDLADWSASPKPPAGIHVQLDSVPKPRERAWLGALAGAGTRVTWSGDLPPLMIDAQPIASPTGGTRVLVAAPSGSSVVIGDDIGAIDTVQALAAGVMLSLGSFAGELRASAGASTASTVQRDSVSLRKVLVVGSAGWESKFVVASLEEDGWKVDAFIRVAPSVSVAQGSAAVIDTSRYSAVIALDGAASPYAIRILEFARTGGGVVLTPQSASMDVLSTLRAGTVGRADAAARSIPRAGSVTHATLPFAPVTSLRSDAAALERRVAAIAIAARRIGAGKALQLGYEDTWRWRLGGDEGAVGDHRLWWTRVVGSVAYQPRFPRMTTSTVVDEAPLIGLVSAIGTLAALGGAVGLTTTNSGLVAWLFVLLAFGIIVEVSSRRLRGAG